MKEYHPLGVFMDQAKVASAYLLRPNSEKKMVAKVKGPATFCTATEFAKLVSEDRVQLYTMGPDGVHISYTDEEKAETKKKIKNPTFYTDDDYYKSEAVFDSASLAYDNFMAITVLAVRSFKLRNMPMLQGAIYLRNAAQDVTSLIKKNSSLATAITSDMFLCNWMLDGLLNIIRQCNCPVTVYRRNMFYTDNVLYSTPMMGFVNPPEYEIARVDSLIDATLSAICSGSSNNSVSKMSLV